MEDPADYRPDSSARSLSPAQVRSGTSLTSLSSSSESFGSLRTGLRRRRNRECSVIASSYHTSASDGEELLTCSASSSKRAIESDGDVPRTRFLSRSRSSDSKRLRRVGRSTDNANPAITEPLLHSTTAALDALPIANATSYQPLLAHGSSTRQRRRDASLSLMGQMPARPPFFAADSSPSPNRPPLARNRTAVSPPELTPPASSRLLESGNSYVPVRTANDENTRLSPFHARPIEGSSRDYLGEEMVRSAVQREARLQSLREALEPTSPPLTRQTEVDLDLEPRLNLPRAPRPSLARQDTPPNMVSPNGSIQAPRLPNDRSQLSSYIGGRSPSPTLPSPSHPLWGEVREGHTDGTGQNHRFGAFASGRMRGPTRASNEQWLSGSGPSSSRMTRETNVIPDDEDLSHRWPAATGPRTDSMNYRSTMDWLRVAGRVDPAGVAEEDRWSFRDSRRARLQLARNSVSDHQQTSESQSPSVTTTAPQTGPRAAPHASPPTNQAERTTWPWDTLPPLPPISPPRPRMMEEDSDGPFLRGYRPQPAGERIFPWDALARGRRSPHHRFETPLLRTEQARVFVRGVETALRSLEQADGDHTTVHPMGTDAADQEMARLLSPWRRHYQGNIALDPRNYAFDDEFGTFESMLGMSDMLGEGIRRTATPQEIAADDGLAIIMAKELDDKGDTSCPICLMEYEPCDSLRILRCHHSYHVDCIDRWLCQSSNSCPTCRATPCVKTPVVPGPVLSTRRAFF